MGYQPALPAITAALDLLPADAVARVVLVVQSAEEAPSLTLPGGELSLVHRSDGDADSALVDAVRALAWLPGWVRAFVHGERRVTMQALRPYLLRERGLERGQVSVSGCRRRGRAEGFREWKTLKSS